MLIRILLLVILVVLLGRAIRATLASAMGVAPPGGKPRSTASHGVKMVRDPVCGTFLPPSHALPEPGARGELVYFCSEACRQQYLARGRRA